MKNLLFITAILFAMASCAGTKDVKTARSELKNEQRLKEQVAVEKAIESGRYIIKFDKLYFSRGRIADLVPQANYIVIDGRKAIINTAYLGRQFDIRPIEGINMRGVTENYEVSKDSAKGKYQVKMNVRNGSASMLVFLNIGKNGTCSASISSMMIDYVSYRGHIVPIKDNPQKATPDAYII